jgi:hypothetical protein
VKLAASRASGLSITLPAHPRSDERGQAELPRFNLTLLKRRLDKHS